MSLSQHDCLQNIQSRLDSLQRHQDAFLYAKAAIEIQNVLDSVKSLPEMSVVLTKLSSQVTQLAIGNLCYFLSCFRPGNRSSRFPDLVSNGQQTVKWIKFCS